MHASSIINYHHNHHHQHYYAHQVAATEESSDASGLGFGASRSLVTPNQTIESDDNEEIGPENTANLAPTSARLDQGPSQATLSGAQLGLTHLTSQKVHSVAGYESLENSHEQYRYSSGGSNNIISENTDDHYQLPLASEVNYYEQPPNSAGCHQAVNLSAEQQQQQHGTFEAPSAAIYYDLSATEHNISPDQVVTSSAPLDYQHQDQFHLHHNHHHHHQQQAQAHPLPHQHHADMSLQPRQEVLIDPQRGASSFAYNHYEPSSDLRYSGAEFVSVLAEQNRAVPQSPFEWQEGQAAAVADSLTSGDGCNQLQQYSSEFAPILRPPDGVQMYRGMSSTAYPNTFSLTAPGGGSSYPHRQLESITSTSGNVINLLTANNENFHQPAAQHPNDCHPFHDKQQLEANSHYDRQRLNYEPAHLLGSNSAGQDPQHAPGDDQRDLAPSRALSSVSESLSMTTNSDMESVDSALTRDERKAREANIPLSYHEIVNLSIDQFNEQLSRFPYTETQLTLMKDIRRRGKNKVAAQTCRKRKMEQITELQQEVAELANRRILLALERSRLMEEHAKLTEEYKSWRTC